MRGRSTLAAIAAALTIAFTAAAAGPHAAPDANAGQGSPGAVSESPGAHPSGRTRAQGGPGIDPGNTQTESGNTRIYSPRGVARPGETVTSGTAEPGAGPPQHGNARNPGGG